MTESYFAASKRLVRRHPAFAVTIVLSLGIGISATSAAMSLVESARYGALPFANAERVEHLYAASRRAPDQRTWEIPLTAVGALTGANGPLQDAAIYDMTSLHVRRDGVIASAWATKASVNLFSVLGSRPLIGRLFDRRDEDGPNVVVLSQDYWEREFGADSSAVGRTIDLNSSVYRVIGIVTRQTAFPENAAFWVPGFSNAEVAVGRGSASVVGLRRTGSTPDATRLRITASASIALANQPKGANGVMIGSVALRSYLLMSRLDFISLILILLAAFLAIVSGVNFTTLTLARGIRRRQEIAVRAALGASAVRLVHEMIAESMLLCGVGGLVGVLLSQPVLAVLRMAFGTLLPPWLTIEIGWRTLAGSVAIAMVAGLAFGIGPAVDLSRTALSEFLKATSPTSSSGAGTKRIRSLLISIQVALATAALVCFGAILGRSMIAGSAALGYDYAPIVRTYVTDSVKSDAVRIAHLDAILGDAAQIPGTQTAGFRKGTYVYASKCMADDGRGLRSAEELGIHGCLAQEISAGFFSTMRPRLIAGRIPSDDEVTHGAPVAVVTKTLANQLFGDRALGSRVRLNGASSTAATIVGVVDDVRDPGEELTTPMDVFVPYGASLLPRISNTETRELWVRVSSLTPGYLRTLGQHLTASGLGGVEISQVQSLDSMVRQALNFYRQLADIVIALFLVALALSALGIHGLVSYTASARTRELAIRESLGAKRAQIAALIVRDAIVQGTYGLAAGAVIAACTLRYLKGSDFDVTAVLITGVVALVVVYATVVSAAVGPIRMTWRRGLSMALRVEG
ncbi:MAG TPA: ABC transporter permease [Gemmatimonadaceae bacterium]|jgi:predicted permease